MGEDRSVPAGLPLLFSPIRIAGRTARSRIVFPSMHTGYAEEDGTVGDRLLAFLEARAAGLGILTLEQANVHPHGRRTSAHQLDFWDDGFVPGVRRVAELAHRHGALALVQLGHAGRQTTAEALGRQPVAPSAATCPRFPDPPRELEVPEILEIQGHFVAAAERAHRAGLDGVELHAAHGFLMSQFLSPCFNRRTDDYGGDTRRRARFVTEVLRRIRGRLGPHFVVGLRLSVVEGVDGGLEVAESRRLGALFVEAGLDLLSCSAGTGFTRHLYCAPMGVEHGHNLPLAAAMKAALPIPVIAAGRLHDPRLAEAALRKGQADMVSIGRGLICDPQLLEKAARGDLADIRPCVGCNQCIAVRPLACKLNARAGRERDRVAARASRPRSVVVIGGGPAGLEAAMVAAARGHRVRLCERESHLGGQLAPGAVPPGKAELLAWVRYAEGQLRRLGVEIHLGETASADTLAALAPECAIVATGGVPSRPPIPGIEECPVVAAADVLAGRAEVGQVVVVVGGGETGCETADHLAATGRQVTVVEMLPGMAQEMVREPRHYLFERLRARGVRLLPSTRVARLLRWGLAVESPAGPAELRADTVILATGIRPDPALAEGLRALIPEVHLIGDAARPGNASDAILQGFEVGNLV